ncbi:TPA_asm: hypothetical protein [Porphyromonas phage phage022a_WW2931]|uniref:Protein SirB1 N-terminal domain-containing protein n=1 Tax=Porphyromonas phage phage022a_WW2931 TaxID=3154112 RepID=A0AAT9J8S1_9CAUD|nr:hypothetical protein [Porphyromonas gingivalis]PDP66847.1 hypothetical protein CLI78_02260 [Porphyromonas gingivalis]
MTAIVGVLNKHAVAIAADSAVTMGDIHKVVNSANKIFTLSKYRPVAVMTYNNAAFMEVPWDIIIKEYRKELGTNSFPVLNDYVADFVRFLHTRHFFSDEQTQRSYMLFLLDSFFSLCRNEILREKGIEVNDQKEVIIAQKLRECLERNKTGRRCPEFERYAYTDFKAYAKSDVDEYAKQVGFNDSELLCVSFFYYLSAQLDIPINTGLVFVGYGEAEIYPSLFPINVSFGMDGHLRYYLEENRVAKISEHGPFAVIAPFAQIDVTQTIVRGINPSFQDIIYNVIGKSFKSFSDAITNIFDGNPSNAEVSDALKQLDMDSIITNITRQIDKEMRETYTDPLLNTVISLDKEDMANMAESFISLTSLVRRMQPGEETVGGPVDVAVISKGDGFVWINRKHYFRPELNASFFNNYFR